MLRRFSSLCLTAGLLLIGCSSQPAAPTGSESPGAPPRTGPARGGEMQALTARGIVDELTSLMIWRRSAFNRL